MCGKKACRCLISCNDLNSSIRELSATSSEWSITCIFLSPFCCAVDSVNELSVPVALLTRYAPICTKPWLTLFFSITPCLVLSLSARQNVWLPFCFQHGVAHRCCIQRKGLSMDLARIFKGFAFFFRIDKETCFWFSKKRRKDFWVLSTVSSVVIDVFTCWREFF